MMVEWMDGNTRSIINNNIGNERKRRKRRRIKSFSKREGKRGREREREREREIGTKWQARQWQRDRLFRGEIDER